MAQARVQGEVCEGCGYVRPYTEFFDDDGPGDMQLLCLRCRTEGIPEPDPIGWEDVHPKHRRLLRAIFEGPGSTFAVAAREVGISPNKGLRQILDESPTTLRAYKAVLRANGFDVVYLGQKLKTLLNAYRPMPTKEDGLVWIPDNTTRMRAVELLHRILGAIPEKAKDSAAGVQVTILNNLGGEAPKDVSAGRGADFVIDVTPQPVNIELEDGG